MPDFHLLGYALTVGTYLAISIGTTTHMQLLLENPVKLPLLGVDLPLFAFYGFAPPLFFLLHAYVLMQLYLLSHSLRLFDTELEVTQVIKKDRERIRSQLDKFVLTQLLVGAPDAWMVRQPTYGSIAGSPRVTSMPSKC
jgi:hypothetical protein